MREGDYIFHLGVGTEAVVCRHLSLTTLFRGSFEVGVGDQVSSLEGRNLLGGLVLFKCKSAGQQSRGEGVSSVHSKASQLVGRHPRKPTAGEGWVTASV